MARKDPSWPGRPLLAAAGLALGLPYVWYVLSYIPPPAVVERFTSPAYFAWFVGQVLLLVAIAAAGLRRSIRSTWPLAGLLGLLLLAMLADDLWRWRQNGGGLPDVPFR